MADTTHIPHAGQSPEPILSRMFHGLTKLALMEPTRASLSRLSQISDADLASSGLTRHDAVRKILGARGLF